MLKQKNAIKVTVILQQNTIEMMYKKASVKNVNVVQEGVDVMVKRYLEMRRKDDGIMQKGGNMMVKWRQNAVMGVLGSSLTSAFVVQNAYLANTKSIGSSNA